MNLNIFCHEAGRKTIEQRGQNGDRNNEGNDASDNISSTCHQYVTAFSALNWIEVRMNSTMNSNTDIVAPEE